MGHTFQVITRTLSLVRTSSASGKFIHGLARKRPLSGCCGGAGWEFALGCFFRSLRSLCSFRFSDTAGCSGVNSCVLFSIASDSLAVQIRGQADARGANKRARENRVNGDLVFGCLRFPVRIPLPLTVTEPIRLARPLGREVAWVRNNAPTEACGKFFSPPPSLGTPDDTAALTLTSALPSPIWSQRVSDQPRLRYSLDDEHLPSVFLVPEPPKQVWKLRSHSHGKTRISGYRRLEISEQRNGLDRRTSRL